MTIRECMLFIYNKQKTITDEKELKVLDKIRKMITYYRQILTYLSMLIDDYYDYSKESKRNNNRYDMIKETRKKIENNSINQKNIEEIKECIYKNR